MKYLICSDIHGSLSAAEKILNFFSTLQCDRLIILGDILYHGPRNPLPEGYNPKAVCELLNSFSDKIISCRGNCDAEVDQKVLNFPIMEDYIQIIDNDNVLFCTHGHVYAPKNDDGSFPVNCEDAKNPKVPENSVIFYGHTHISILEKNKNGLIICNPGSVSLPKGNTQAGFAIYDDRKISLYNMEGIVLKVMKI